MVTYDTLHCKARSRIRRGEDGCTAIAVPGRLALLVGTRDADGVYVIHITVGCAVVPEVFSVADRLYVYRPFSTSSLQIDNSYIVSKTDE